MQKFALSLTLALTCALAANMPHAETIRVFSGGQGQRPDLMRKLFDQFEAQNPGTKIEIETGGQSAELQREHLSKVLTAQSDSLDVFMLDITNQRSYASKGWLEPLNGYLGQPSDVLANHLPIYRTTNVIDGKLVSVPAFADAMFVYYRRDLMSKYNLSEPRTLEQLSKAAKTVMAGEKDPALQGFSIQGAPIEGAVCTFLLPLWSAGNDIADENGKYTLDNKIAEASIKQWLQLIDDGVVPKNVSEIKTIDTVNDFKAGKVLFAVNWGFAWDKFQNDADSKVKGKVDVMMMPRTSDRGKSNTCIGGWQWAVSAYSKHKPIAAKLVNFMSQPKASKLLAVEGSLLPVFPAVYSDEDYMAKVPWARGAGVIATFAKSRPASARYGEVSDAVRSTTSAMLAGKLSPERGIAEISAKLRPILK
jgi:multiple sugar transport system substrate-binding protein